MIYILLGLLPFVQIGLTYYFSVQTVAAVLIFACTFRYTVSNSFLVWIYTASVALLMLISVYSISGTTEEDIFRRGREVFFFTLICLSARGYSDRSPFKITQRSHLPIVAVAGALAILATAQYIFLNSGRYLGLPKTLYIANADTLPDLLDLMYGKLRPFGTFGEPSYFSFILLSLFVMLSPLAGLRLRKRARGLGDGSLDPKWMKPASYLAILGCLAVGIAGTLSQSLSFYLAFPVLLYACIVRFSNPRVQLWFAICIGVAIAILLGSSFLNAVLSRVSLGTADLSTSARFIKPLQIIPQFLVEHPFGSPLSKWIETISPISAQYGVPAIAVGHNALFNSFFNYGVIGFACLAFTIGAPKSASMKTYVALSFLFNGSIFSVDKYFVIVLTIAIYSSYQYVIGGPKSEAARKLASPARAVGVMA